ncbi:hypothetical protein MERGE_001461 [Pneumocystis wakefieldiae]|uniref:MARVEL domain-containing protein n=1 Tax=Pneumocystis wakefieldiae TaxID=38082 RepID=A0A899G3B4_9ASCO|nr:hypothetical protein MERGE_001461 [Pneumocystis wakefieldiae]
MAEKYIYIIIRILAIVVGLLILSLSIDINQQRRYKNHVQLREMNFTLFTGLFSIITVVFEFIKASVPALNHPVITLINDILNLIFTFSASIILSHITGFGSCSNTAYETCSQTKSLQDDIWTYAFDIDIKRYSLINRFKKNIEVSYTVQYKSSNTFIQNSSFAIPFNSHSNEFSDLKSEKNLIIHNESSNVINNSSSDVFTYDKQRYNKIY